MGWGRLCRHGVGTSRVFKAGVIYHYAVVMLLGLTLAIGLVALWDTLETAVDPGSILCLLLHFYFALPPHGEVLK